MAKWRNIICFLVAVAVIVQVGAFSVLNQTFNNFDESFDLKEQQLGEYDDGIPYSLPEIQRRKSKLFPLFTIIRFTNEPCQGSDPLERGVCYTRNQCTNNLGVSIGTCAQGLGTCCQFYATCGNVITQNNTLFRNPDYPSKYRPTTVGDICQVRVRKQLNVCQLRLNFLKFDIDGPVGPPPAGQTPPMNNDGGSCKTDAFTVSSSGTAAPTICGNMANQHIYLDFGSSDTMTINVMLSSNANRDREWNIEILMIPCRSERRAPTGCLQYFQGISGQIQSFNFGGGTHLANLDYSSCIRQEDGMRSIEWSACQPGDVKINGGIVTPAPTTAPTAPLTCTGATAPPMNGLQDYLTIPGGLAFPLLPSTAPIMYSTTDRYCDIHFATAGQIVRSVVKPFLLHFRTDSGEIPVGTASPTQEASVGFCLRYQQSPQGLI